MGNVEKDEVMILAAKESQRLLREHEKQNGRLRSDSFSEDQEENNPVNPLMSDW